MIYYPDKRIPENLHLPSYPLVSNFKNIIVYNFISMIYVSVTGTRLL